MHSWLGGACIKKYAGWVLNFQILLKINSYQHCFVCKMKFDGQSLSLQLLYLLYYWFHKSQTVEWVPTLISPWWSQCFTCLYFGTSQHILLMSANSLFLLTWLICVLYLRYNIWFICQMLVCVKCGLYVHTKFILTNILLSVNWMIL